MRSLKILIFCILIAGCTKTVEDTFSVPNDYQSWKKPINEILTYVVPGHADGARIIYANSKAFQVAREKMQDGRMRYDFIDGSIIIKEKYKSEDEIGSAEPILTIMVKNRTDSRSVNGWLYYMQQPGKDVVFVESKMCSGCHDAANEKHPYFDKNEDEDYRDFIFVPF